MAKKGVSQVNGRGSLTYTYVRETKTLFIYCKYYDARMDFKACRKRATSDKLIYEDCRGCLHWVDVVEIFQDDLFRRNHKPPRTKIIIPKQRKRI